MVIPNDVDCRSRTSCYIVMKFIQLPTTNRKFRKDLNIKGPQDGANGKLTEDRP